MTDLVEQEILYSGRVQGVGFRQSVSILASKRKVRGYVQNLGNGKVRLVVGGNSEQVIDFLKSIKTMWATNISHVEVNDMQPSISAVNFTVRY